MVERRKGGEIFAKAVMCERRVACVRGLEEGRSTRQQRRQRVASSVSAVFPGLRRSERVSGERLLTPFRRCKPGRLLWVQDGRFCSGSSALILRKQWLKRQLMEFIRSKLRRAVR